MKSFLPHLVLFAGICMSLGGPAVAQDQHSDHSPTPEELRTSGNLSEQLETLRHKVHLLEKKLQTGQPTAIHSGSGESAGKSMNMGQDMGQDMARDGGMGMGMGMGMMKKDMGMNMGMGKMKKGMEMGAMNRDMGMGMGMMKKQMGMMKDGMGMMGMMKGMGSMGGMADMSMESALPGFPGASHLYHVGATGFFLNHEGHIELTPQQKTKLNVIREKTALQQASTDRKIEEAEQQLWELTAADQPDAKAIAEKIREIETLRGDQRLAFIRAVGEAAGVLSPHQHNVLVGGPKAPSESSHKNH